MFRKKKGKGKEKSDLSLSNEISFSRIGINLIKYLNSEVGLNCSFLKVSDDRWTRFGVRLLTNIVFFLCLSPFH